MKTPALTTSFVALYPWLCDVDPTFGRMKRRGVRGRVKNYSSQNIEMEFNIEGYDPSGDYIIETLTERLLVHYLERKDVTLADPDGGPTVKGQVKITLHFERL